jgi:hypothetical protein
MKGMWKIFCKAVDAAAYWVGDRVTDLTGLIALPRGRSGRLRSLLPSLT